MAADIVKGYTFGATETVTNTKLHSLVDDATVTGIDQSNATAGMITVTGTQPTATDGHGWQDSAVGAGYDVWLFADNSAFEIVGEYALAYNNSGTTIGRGALVQYDESSASVDGRVAVKKTTIPTSGGVQQARPIGVAFREIANGSVGPLLSKGKMLLIKDAATVAAGDPVVPSITTIGQATTNALGSWGDPFGSGAIGIWLEASAAAAGTEVMAYLFGAQRGSWAAFKNSGGTTVFNATPTPGSWQDAGAFATAPLGTVAHICQITLSKSATNGILLVGLRMKNATVDIGSGAAVICSGATLTAGANDYNTLRGQVLVAETTAESSNTLQYYVSGSDTTNLTLTIKEVGVIVGGQVV